MVITAIAPTIAASACANDEERAEPELVEVYLGLDSLGQNLGEDEGELIGPRFDLQPRTVIQPSVETTVTVNASINLDFDSDGRLIGVELLGAQT